MGVGSNPQEPPGYTFRQTFFNFTAPATISSTRDATTIKLIFIHSIFTKQNIQIIIKYHSTCKQLQAYKVWEDK